MTTIDKAMEALLEDDDVSEILVDGAKSVYVERNGALHGTEIRFADDGQVVGWANGLLAGQGWGPVGKGIPGPQVDVRRIFHLLRHQANAVS